MTDPFVAQLAALSKAHVTRAKWIFVPNHGVGRTIGERIALEGTNWLNLRFVTPLDVALRMGAPFLVERDIDPSEEGLGPALMMRLLLDLDVEPGYFKPLANQPTMAQALYATVRELRMAGIKSSDLRAEAFESADKADEMQALLAAYEKFLADHQRGDMASVYEEAMLHPDWCPIQPEDCWTELPNTIWSPLQRRLIDAMPGEPIIPRALEIPAATLPRRSGGRRLGPAQTVTPDHSTPLAFLLSPASSQHDTRQAESREPRAESRISLFHAGGREAEVEEALRRILNSRVPLDNVEIACASREDATLIWEKACRHEWPVTIGPGIPATVTRPGRALLAWCDWIDGRFAARDFRHMLQSGDVAVDVEGGPTPGRAARLLALSEATWGRETYDIALTRLTRKYQGTADDEERSAESRELAGENAVACEALKTWIRSLLDAVPQPGPDGKVSLRVFVAAAESLIEACCETTSALDGAARRALAEVLEELHALDRFQCTLAQAIAFVRERATSVSVAADRARPGHLHISSLPQAGYAGRPQLFVIGLEEGRVFPAGVEDPVLLDIEREQIGPLLRLSSDRTDEAVYAVLSRLAVAPENVTLSYSSLDTRQYRESLPSWILLQACRLIEGDAALTYDGLLKHLGEPVSCVPASQHLAVSEAGWWLAGLKDAPRAGRVGVLRHFRNAARGVEAAEHRQTDSFTQYDGLVPAAGAALDPVANRISVSASTLQDAAACPYSYFIKRCLRVEPIEMPKLDRDAWLDALARGSELHALYAALIRRCRDEGRRPDVAKDAWILEQAEARLAELCREMPPPSPEVFDRERRDFVRDVELFLKHESERTGSEPVGLEVSFGRSYEADDSEPLARPEPVAIPLGKGRTLLLTGRIDRIDRTGPSRYEVIDYKAGRYWPDKWKGTFAAGTRLQHALYGVAAAELLKRTDPKAKVERGVYLFTSARGGMHPVSISDPGASKIAEVLEDLLAVISSGAFVHTDDGDDCRYCDFGPACGPGAPARAAVKRTNPGESHLESMRRLAAHE